MLFDVLNTFDLAAAFECCRIDWKDAKTPYDKSGFMRGWEMQTGVMAFRNSPRVRDFWGKATDEYERRRVRDAAIIDAC